MSLLVCNPLIPVSALIVLVGGSYVVFDNWRTRRKLRRILGRQDG